MPFTPPFAATCSMVSESPAKHTEVRGRRTQKLVWSVPNGLALQAMCSLLTLLRKHVQKNCSALKRAPSDWFRNRAAAAIPFDTSKAPECEGFKETCNERVMKCTNAHLDRIPTVRNLLNSTLQRIQMDTGWSSWSRKKLGQATAIDSTAQQRPSLRPPLREERRPNASTASTNAIPGGLETLTLTSLIFPFGNLTEMRMPEGINIFAEFGARCLLFDRKLACLTEFHGLSNSSIQGPTTFVGWHFQASKARSSERTAYLVDR